MPRSPAAISSRSARSMESRWGCRRSLKANEMIRVFFFNECFNLQYGEALLFISCGSTRPLKSGGHDSMGICLNSLWKRVELFLGLPDEEKWGEFQAWSG